MAKGEREPGPRHVLARFREVVGLTGNVFRLTGERRDDRRVDLIE